MRARQEAMSTVQGAYYPYVTKTRARATPYCNAYVRFHKKNILKRRDASKTRSHERGAESVLSVRDQDARKGDAVLQRIRAFSKNKITNRSIYYEKTYHRR